MDDAIKFWISHGADGIFLDGLEIFDVNVWVAQKISYCSWTFSPYSWVKKLALGPFRIGFSGHFFHPPGWGKIPLSH